MSSHNTLGRMTDMLFEELERLNAVDVTDGDALAAEDLANQLTLFDFMRVDNCAVTA